MQGLNLLGARFAFGLRDGPSLRLGTHLARVLGTRVMVLSSPGHVDLYYVALISSLGLSSMSLFNDQRRIAS